MPPKTKAKPKNYQPAKPREIVPGFAALVRTTRERLQWSQRELARVANVSPMCVSDVEGEKRSPSLRVASRIAAALELTCFLAEPGQPGKPVRAARTA